MGEIFVQQCCYPALSAAFAGRGKWLGGRGKSFGTKHRMLRAQLSVVVIAPAESGTGVRADKRSAGFLQHGKGWPAPASVIAYKVYIAGVASQAANARRRAARSMMGVARASSVSIGEDGYNERRGGG